MTRNQILEALNGDNYQALLVIYNKYKINKKFDVFFAQHENPGKEHMHFKMLHKQVREIMRKLEQNKGFELEIILPITKPTTTPASTPAKPIPEPVKTELPLPEISIRRIERVVIDSNPHVNRADLPEDLQKLYDDNGRMNGEMKTKHALMKAATDDGKRKELVNELASLEDSINANWEIIDKWYTDFKAGKKDEPAKVLSPVDLAKKIEAAKKYLDRYFDSKDPKQIIKFNDYKKFLLSLGIDYIPRPLRDNKRTPKPKKK